MAIQITPNYLKRDEIARNSYTVILPPGITYDQIFQPIFWAHCARTLRKYDLITVVAFDGEFDVTLRVIGLPKGASGANVQLSPRVPAGVPVVAAQVVPRVAGGKFAVRVDWTKTTNFRVIALDGSTYADGFETKEAAESVMAKYMHELGLVFPTDTPADEDDKTTAKKPAAKKDAA